MTHGCHNRPPLRDWHHAQDGYHPMTAKTNGAIPNALRSVRVA